MATVKDIIDLLEQVAPPALQESYDNAGIQVGEVSPAVTGVLLCLDVTEAIVDEAIALGANLIVSHHPLLFKGLKRITGNTYIERVVMKALRGGISIYAAHTNLDATLVNRYWARMLGLVDVEILQPATSMLVKMVVYVPCTHTEQLRQLLCEAGAGSIGNYDCCSYVMRGEGAFRPGEEAHPYCGEAGVLHREPEDRVEVILPRYKLGRVLQTMLAAHPYEEPAYDIIPLDNEWHAAGSGVIGNLPQECDAMDFLLRVKQTMGCDSIRHTAQNHSKIKRVALCGGAGGFLADAACRGNAQLFITGEMGGYHHFHEYAGRLIVAEIGHYESEKHTKEIFYDVIRKKFSTFAIHLSKVETNPIKYL